MGNDHYATIRDLLDDVIRDLDSLSGDCMPDTPEPWQTTANRLADTFRLLEDRTRISVAHGRGVVWPSVDEALEGYRNDRS